MAISCNNQIFSLHTKHSTYQMKVDRDFLIHTYYGPYVGDSDMSYLARCIDRGFSGNPDGITDKGYSLDTQLLEYLLTGPEISEMTVCGWLMQTAVR